MGGDLLILTPLRYLNPTGWHVVHMLFTVFHRICTVYYAQFFNKLLTAIVLSSFIKHGLQYVIDDM